MLKAELQAQKQRILAIQLAKNKQLAADQLLRIRLELSKQALPQSIPGSRNG
jgi:hypothetical protein